MDSLANSRNYDTTPFSDLKRIIFRELRAPFFTAEVKKKCETRESVPRRDFSEISFCEREFLNKEGPRKYLSRTLHLLCFDHPVNVSLRSDVLIKVHKMCRRCSLSQTFGIALNYEIKVQLRATLTATHCINIRHGN